MLRSRTRRCQTSLDGKHAAGLGRGDARRRGWTARFDGSGADSRHEASAGEEVRFARDSLTGGGALLSNLDLVLRHATGLPISIADEPLTGVALGAGRVLEEMQTLKNVMINMW